MVNIQLTPYYRITSDKMNYILEERSKSKDKNGEYTWRSIKWASTIEHILKSFKELELRTSNAESIEELLEIAKGIDKKIEKVLGG